VDLLLRLAVAAIGIGLILVCFRSIIPVAFINRLPDDVILNLSGRLTAILLGTYRARGTGDVWIGVGCGTGRSAN
jgi:hypothetical protein